MKNFIHEINFGLFSSDMKKQPQKEIINHWLTNAGILFLLWKNWPLNFFVMVRISTVVFSCPLTIWNNKKQTKKCVHCLLQSYQTVTIVRDRRITKCIEHVKSDLFDITILGDILEIIFLRIKPPKSISVSKKSKQVFTKDIDVSAFLILREVLYNML